jgi:hypothetical protein
LARNRQFESEQVNLGKKNARANFLAFMQNYFSPSENDTQTNTTTTTTTTIVNEQSNLPEKKYRVEIGETVQGIADKFKITAGDIIKLNAFPDGFDINEGFIARFPIILPGKAEGVPEYTEEIIPEKATAGTQPVENAAPQRVGNTSVANAGNATGKENNEDLNLNTEDKEKPVVINQTLLALQAAEAKELEEKNKLRETQKTINPKAKLTPEMKETVNWDATLQLFMDANQPVGVKELSTNELIKWTKICLRDGWLPDQPVPLARKVVERPQKEGYFVYATCSFDQAFAYGRREHPGQLFYWYYNIGETINTGPSNTELSPAHLWANVEACYNHGRTPNYDWIASFATDPKAPQALADIKKIPESQPKERQKSQAFYDLVTYAQKNIYTDEKDADKINGTFSIEFEERLIEREADNKAALKEQEAKAVQQKKDDILGKLNEVTGLTRYVRDGKELLINQEKYMSLLLKIVQKDLDGVLTILKEPGLANPEQYLCLLEYSYRIILINLFSNDSNFTAQSELLLAYTIWETQRNQYPQLKADLTKDNNKLYGSLRSKINDNQFARRLYQSGTEYIMGITDFGEYAGLINAAPGDQAFMVLGMSNRDLAVLSWPQREKIMDNILEKESYPDAVDYLILSTPEDQKENIRLKIFYGDYQAKLTALMNSDQRKLFYELLGKVFPDQENTVKLDTIGKGDNAENGTIATELTQKEKENLDSGKRIDLILYTSYDSKYMGTFGGLGDASMQAIIDLINTTSSKKRVITTTVRDYSSKGPIREDMDGGIIQPMKTITTETDRSDQDDLRDFFIADDGNFLMHLYDQFSGPSLDALRKAVGNLFINDWRLIGAVTTRLYKKDEDLQQLAWFLIPAILDQMSGTTLFDLLNQLFGSEVTLVSVPGTAAKIPVTNVTSGPDDKMETLGIDILHSINSIPQPPVDNKDPEYAKQLALYTAAVQRKTDFTNALIKKPGVVFNMFFEATAIVDETNLYGMKKEFFNLTHNNTKADTDAQIKKAQTAQGNSDHTALVDALSVMDDARMSQIVIKDRLNFVRQICLIDKGWWEKRTTAVGDEKEQLIISLFRSTPAIDTDTGDDAEITSGGNTKGPKSDINTMLDALVVNGGALYNQIASVVDGAEFGQFHETIRRMGMLRAIGLTGQKEDSKDVQAEQNDKLNALYDQQEEGNVAGIGAKNMLLYANPGLLKQVGEWQKKYNITVRWVKEDGKDKIEVTSYVVYPGQEYISALWPAAGAGTAATATTFEKNTKTYDPYEMVGVIHLIRDSDRGINQEGQIEYLLAINLFNIENSQNKQTAWQLVDMVLLVLSVIPFTAPVGNALRGLRLILAVVDLVVATTFVILDSYRSDLASTPAGRNFLNFFDLLMMVYMGAGIIRLAQMLADPRTYQRFIRLLSGAKAVAKNSLAKLDEWLQSVMKISEEGGATDNALAEAQKTGDTKALKDNLKDSGLNDKTAELGQQQANNILRENPTGGGEPVIKRPANPIELDTPIPPKKPTGSNSSSNSLSPQLKPQPGENTNVLYRFAKSEPKGGAVPTTTQEVMVFKSDGQITQVRRTILDGAEADIKGWTYSTGAKILKDDMVWMYLQEDIEPFIKSVQPEEVVAAQGKNMWGVPLETPEGIAGKQLLKPVPKVEINKSVAKTGEVTNTGDVNKTGEVNKTGDVNKTGEVTKPQDTGGPGTEFYKVTEPDGTITIYKDKRVFKVKGGKYYEVIGGIEKEFKTRAEFEEALGGTIESVPEKPIDKPIEKPTSGTEEPVEPGNVKPKTDEEIISEAKAKLKDQSLGDKLEADIKNNPALRDALAKNPDLVKGWEIIESYPKFRIDPKRLEEATKLVTNPKLQAAGFTSDQLRRLIESQKGLGSPELSQLLTGLDNLITGGTKFENIEAMITEFRKGNNFAVGERFILRYIVENPAGFMGKTLKFEEVTAIGDNVRRYDLICEGERLEFYEFKSTSEIPPPGFAKQFLNDLRNKRGKVKWIFDVKKSGTLKVDDFVAALEKETILKKDLTSMGFDSKKQFIDWFRDSFDAIFFAR